MSTSAADPDRTSARVIFTRAEIIQAATTAANIVNMQTLELFPEGRIKMPDDEALKVFQTATEAVTISILRAAYAVEKRATRGAR